MDVKVIVFNLFTLTEWVKHFLYSHDHLFVCLFDLTVILLEYSRFYSVQVLGAEESILIIDIVFQVFKYISFNKTMTQLSATLNNVTYHFSLIQGFHYILIFSSPLACCIYSPPPLSPPPPPLLWPETHVVLHTKTNWWPTRNQSRGNWYSLWPFWPL